MATRGFQVHDRSGKKLVCELCDTKVDTCLYKCVDCDIYICDICVRAHNRLKQTRDHKILKDQHGPLPPSRAETRCTSHPGEDVAFYCHTCMVFICSFCITSNHTNHKCSVIKQASENMSQELGEQLKNLRDNFITVLRSHVKHFEYLQTRNEEQHKVNVKNIKAQTDELVNEIKQIQTKFIHESESNTNQNKLRLTKLHDDVVKKAEELEYKYSVFNNILTSGSDIDKIMARNEVLEFMGQNQSQIQNEKIQIFKFIPGEMKTNSLERSFGLIDVIVGDTADTVCTPEESAKLLVGTKKTKVRSSIQDITADKRTDSPESRTPTPGTDKYPSGYKSNKAENNKTKDSTYKDGSNHIYSDIELNNDIKSTFRHLSTTVRSICPISDTTAYIRCEGEYSINRVDNSGQLQDSMKLEFMARDFIVTSECDFICSAANSKNIFKVSKRGQIIENLYTGSLYPRCLCLSSDGDILVTMCDSWSYDAYQEYKSLVTRMTTAGQTLTTYEYNNKRRLFKFPMGIDENTNKDICVVNRINESSGYLVILNESGILKCTYKGQGNEIFYPVRVKCDRLGQIIVSDFHKKIHLLNNNGRLIKYLMTDKDLQHSPWSLGIGTNNLLWVGCKNGQVYIVKY